MKKLIIIEGFDRSGKDTLVKDLFNFFYPNLSNTYVYIGDLSGLPKYDKEQEDFLSWLNKLLSNQISDFNKLFETYDNIIMNRLLISDEVYSTLFNREHTCIKYINNLRKDVEIYNYCILFNDYNEYINRLKIIKDDVIQYNKNDFDKINKLYKEILNKFNYQYYINYIYSTTSKNDILRNFLNYYLKLNYYEK